MLRRAALVLIMCVVARPESAAAQVDTIARAPRWVSQFSSASGNVLLSGITAGVTQRLKGGSFRDGFTRGALGGLVIYAGKRIAVEDFYGAGLLGRQINNVGASMVWNASDGLKTFERLAFPFGFGRVYWEPAADKSVQVKIDVLSAAYVIYGIAESELDFEASKSFSSGAPVFSTRNRIIQLGDEQKEVGGVVAQSVIFLSDVPQWGQDVLRRNRAHERVHVLQMDQLFLTLNASYDDRLLGRLPIDLNLSSEMLRILSWVFGEHGSRPWELEAIHLSR